MDELIQELEQLMGDWMQSLSNMTYEEISAYVDSREQIIERMKSHSLSPTERNKYTARVQRLLQHDALILAKMNELRDEGLQGTSKINRGRLQKTAYETEFVLDSVFFDRKK
ncbi:MULTISPECIES: flagellar protein FliT [Paenibacillus]|uniref:flagellar protein FliT n=1 Tax=Paenibacillus TaxID=44249 RepID=UPI0006CF3B2F|nr:MULTISPECIES: flagellar protein FliT [Paenibacillus]GCL73690.1 flagellar protein FliT [Paenibacillus naphthalenovorans]SDJ13006.1 hypothetical protein SAMN05421868_11814 [Paenibacillus naphthalenovorans]